jgi:uncharacterized protein DUF3987
VPRRLKESWLDSYVQYASISEAPKIFHFWAGVSAVAGALRRHVWFDQIKFRWFPSFFIVFVAPPGIATKSTTADGSMDLLREVPGIHFGPDEVTWQSLVTTFAASSENFQIGDEWHPQSPITVLCSEFGMYMDFRDTKMVNLHITLWDGRNRFEKQTKGSGNDVVEAPWINLLACTTPQWISANMDENTIGGGFTSRCIFVYGDTKERPIAYLKKEAKFDYGSLRADLIHDLEWIATKVLGEYVMDEDAEVWGTAWYAKLWGETYTLENEDWVNNYLSRKQAHLHKLAMVIAASRRDETIITLSDIKLAEVMLNSTEEHAHKVFSKVGKSPEAVQASRLLEVVAKRGEMPYKELFRLSQSYFPDAKDFEGVLASFIKGGQVKMGSLGGEIVIKYLG